jgi:hypothetical protein
MLNFLRNPQTVFPSSCTIYTPTNKAQVLQFLHILEKHLLFHNALLIGVERYLILICISLMINDIKLLVMCLLAICISSLGTDLFHRLPIFELVDTF